MDSKDRLRKEMEWEHFNTHKFERAPRGGDGAFLTGMDSTAGTSPFQIQGQKSVHSTNLRALDTTLANSVS